MDIKTDTKLKPKYFPHLIDETMPVVRDGMVETLAFILSGIDPSDRVNPERVHLNLRQLIVDPSVKRIGSSSVLRDDHQLILSPRYDFDQVDFDEVWQDARQVASGQESTKFLKLVKQLHLY